MRRRATLAASLAAIAGVAGTVVVVAFGSQAREGPSHRAYVADVNAICEEYGQRLDRIPPPGDLSSPGAVVESLERALPVLRAQARTIRALPRPRADEQRLARFFRLTDRSLVELQAALDAALARALYPMATALTRFGERRDRAKAVARSLGFDC